ncbi:MAG: DUF1127 domain-containing protein [Rhizobiales bacterium]|nr:DUF1127 domain-containing protein [Hyphomicrobiales bacterium]
MTTLAFPSRNGFSPFRAVASFVVNFVEGIREGHEIRNRYEQLSRLSDAELRHRGLYRTRIAQAAVRGL